MDQLLVFFEGSLVFLLQLFFGLVFEFEHKFGVLEFLSDLLNLPALLVDLGG